MDPDWDMGTSVTLNTLIWQLAECRCCTYSPFSFCLNVSSWMRNGTPFSPPCFLGVNSVLMQCTLPQRPQTHSYTKNQSSSCTMRVINIVCVCVCGISTCTNTDARLETSHRNSAALSWEAWVWGSVIPTHIGISITNMELSVFSEISAFHAKNENNQCGEDVPMSRRRSPGRFHFQPSSC